MNDGELPRSYLDGGYVGETGVPLVSGVNLLGEELCNPRGDRP